MAHNSEIIRVLKAPTTPVTDFASLQLPMLASDKEDGIRCVTHPLHGPCSQWMKPIPNEYVRQVLAEYSPICLDGELVTFNKDGTQKDFNGVQSDIMSEEGYPDFKFLVFDWFGSVYPAYEERFERVNVLVQALNREYPAPEPAICVLEQKMCYDVTQIEACEADALRRGKEGIMLRNPRGWYKEGRSTLSESYLLKVKRFTDDEARVIALEEEMENCNLATRSAGGLQQRSKHQSGMKPKGCVGKLICEWRGKVIKIGSGLTDVQKYWWWGQPDLIIGQTITFKYQAHGMKDLPRAPIFKGIRHD